MPRDLRDRQSILEQLAQPRETVTPSAPARRSRAQPGFGFATAFLVYVAAILATGLLILAGRWAWAFIQAAQ